MQKCLTLQNNFQLGILSAITVVGKANNFIEFPMPAWMFIVDFLSCPNLMRSGLSEAQFHCHQEELQLVRVVFQIRQFCLAYLARNDWHSNHQNPACPDACFCCVLLLRLDFSNLVLAVTLSWFYLALRNSTVCIIFIKWTKSILQETSFDTVVVEF